MSPLAETEGTRRAQGVRAGAEPLAFLLADPASAAELPREQVPTLLAQLAALQSMLATRLLTADPHDHRQHPDGPEEGSQLLTVPQVAALLAVPRAYAYELARRGVLPTVRIGPKYIRVPAAALREWVASLQEAGLDNPAQAVRSHRRGRRRGLDPRG